MQRTVSNSRERQTGRLLLGLAILSFGLAGDAVGQTFSSGSTGADGDLIITTAGVTNFTTAPVGGGSIYHFKTITIAAGSTLKLSGSIFPGPLYFLAQNAVTVAGTIDLSGQGGSVPTTAAQRTGPTVPGAGGYGGGQAAFGGLAQLAGLGPAGGGTSAGYSCSGSGGGPASFSGNQFLVPLVGGSGGGGYNGSGGAGGGALLIASSVSISVTGTISATGGGGAGRAGGGAGGGIRLVAPAISGTGTINSAGGASTVQAVCSNSANNGGANGVIRLEFFQNTFTGTTAGNVYTATPVNLFLPAVSAQPSIMVTSIGGIAVPASPTGSFTVPDVTLVGTSPLTVNIKASNIPLGTVPVVYFSTQNNPDQQITANAGLAGTLASSTTTATVTLSPGYTIGYVTATWTQ